MSLNLIDILVKIYILFVRLYYKAEILMHKKASSIIDNLKNIVAKTKRRFFGASPRRQSDDKISFDEAADIQKEAYVKSRKRIKSEKTPPYMELAAQLLADEVQIFQAAANHLADIAAARPKYKAPIKAIFAEVIANRRLSQEKMDYIKRKLNDF